MNNRKIVQYVCVNVALFLLFFIILDITVYYRHLYMSFRYNIFDNISYIEHISRKMGKDYIDKVMFEKNEYPPTIKGNPSKPIIVLFGCSFAEGAGLSYEQTFAYKLAKQTGQTVYNRSTGGWGTQHMLYQLRSPKLYSVFEKDDNISPQYFIYLYIDDHINRIHVAMQPILFGGYPTFVYKNKGNNLVLDSGSFFRFPFLSYAKEIQYYKFNSIEMKSEFLKKHILLSKKEIDNHYSNNKNKPKFVVLIYNYNYEILSIVQDLIEHDIIVIPAEKLVGHSLNQNKYFINKYDWHPNSLAWDIVTPKFINYLNKYDSNAKGEILNFVNNKIETEYPDINIKTKLNTNILQNFNYDCSGFSICRYDNENIANGKTTKFKAKLSYLLLCSENFFGKFGRNSFTKRILNFAIHINPNNNIYKEYLNEYYN